MTLYDIGHKSFYKRNNGNILNNIWPSTLEIRIYYVFVLNIEIKISFFYYYLLINSFEYVYIKFDSVF